MKDSEKSNKKTFIVHAKKVAVRAYEVEADSEKEAIDKVIEELYPADPITANDFFDPEFYVV